MADRKKILIIRFSSIGDIVLTSPIIRCLKNQIPDCELHFLTKKSYLSLVDNNPYLDKVYSIRKELSEVFSDLINEKYTNIVDLHNNLRSNRVRRKLNVSSTYLDKVNLQKWLMVNFKVNVLPDRHIVERSFDTVKKLGVHNDLKGLEFHESLNDELDDIQGFSLSNPYIAIVLAGSYFTKQIPRHKISKIIQGLELPVILIGGEDERKLSEEIERECTKKVVNACGKLRIGQSAVIIKKSKLVISPDTGMMHIAAAFNKKIISVWGNTIAEFGMYPYLINGKQKLRISEQDIIQVKNLSCRPCTKLGKDRCPKKHFKCMNDIDERSIISKANSLA